MSCRDVLEIQLEHLCICMLQKFVQAACSLRVFAHLELWSWFLLCRSMLRKVGYIRFVLRKPKQKINLKFKASWDIKPCRLICRVSGNFMSRPAGGPPSLVYNGYRFYFPGVKRPGRGVHHPSPPSAEVTERVQLYLYFPSGSPWLVLEWTLPFYWQLYVITTELDSWPHTESKMYFQHWPDLQPLQSYGLWTFEICACR
jgi:hypothetical protein